MGDGAEKTACDASRESAGKKRTGSHQSRGLYLFRHLDLARIHDPAALAELVWLVPRRTMCRGDNALRHHRTQRAPAPRHSRTTPVLGPREEKKPAHQHARRARRLCFSRHLDTARIHEPAAFAEITRLAPGKQCAVVLQRTGTAGPSARARCDNRGRRHSRARARKNGFTSTRVEFGAHACLGALMRPGHTIPRLSPSSVGRLLAKRCPVPILRAGTTGPTVRPRWTLRQYAKSRARLRAAAFSGGTLIDCQRHVPTTLTGADRMSLHTIDGPGIT